VSTVVWPAAVIVWPGGQVETVVYTISVTLVAGTELTGAAGVLLVGLAVHFVQTVKVDVEVMYTVDGLGVAKTEVTPALVTVCPTGQVVTLVETITVVMTVDGIGIPAGDDSTGEFGVEEATAVDTGVDIAPVKGMELGQLVMRPGFWGTKAAQIPMR
jgi:hypothetical protein